MSDFLDKLGAAPLADPLKAFKLPGERKPRRKRSPAELAVGRAERAAKKARLDREAAERRATLYAYYASTTVPLDRVAAHIGVSEKEAAAGLARYGRVN